MVHLILDGMNVIGARPDGWWRDRPRARRRLVAQLGAARPTLGAGRLTVVFDGRPSAAEADPASAPAEVEVLFAPGGPDAADDVIAAMVASAADPGGIVVVTSDARLAARVTGAGGSVEGASGFRRRLGGDDR